ncbi:hypothetical protein KBX50_04740 [Micromonospora sp. C51]|uniref:hypothetical protein n=1 Tax=Micromonospora sp. C51 TaxID=2824879 RepID=UPI001B396FA8|nr:hypothetical protein [Micromonospora sp. C51]MBQ1047796.1 hypothetical protein [Micromonospora sp. C51]
MGRVRIMGAKETRVAFSDSLTRVENGDRLIVMRGSTIATVLVPLDFYDRARGAIGEPPMGLRQLKSVDMVRGQEWTQTLSAVAAGAHVTLLRLSRPVAAMLPPAYYSQACLALGEGPELALD